jgi:acyl-CoA synthetase (NDP forming)
MTTGITARLPRKPIMQIIEEAVKKGVKNLSESDSKKVLAAYGIPVTLEFVVRSMDVAVEKSETIGYPVALKAVGENVLHKTESDWVVLNLKDRQQVRDAYCDLMSRNNAAFEEVLVQQMIKGNRELMAGLKRDPQFGPCVLFGMGGVLTEILEDISIRVAPLERLDAMDMMEDIRGKKILDAFRGKPPIDREALADILLAVGRIGLEQKDIFEIDINPIKFLNGKPVAVDALIVFGAKDE